MDDKTQLLVTAVIFITFLLGVASYFYAVKIKDKPFERTWLSVVVGVGFTQGAIWAIQLVALLALDLIQYWWIVVIPPVIGWAISGIPMIIGQEQKYRADSKNADTYKRGNGQNNG